MCHLSLNRISSPAERDAAHSARLALVLAVEPDPKRARGAVQRWLDLPGLALDAREVRGALLAPLLDERRELHDERDQRQVWCRVE